jgi:transposase
MRQPLTSSANATSVIGQSSSRKILNEIDRSVPDGLDIHIVMDNCATHMTSAIRHWCARRARWRVHFTPTGSSWLNMVERFFAEITERQSKRGVHRSERELEPVILAYIETRNKNPNPLNGFAPPTTSWKP